MKKILIIFFVFLTGVCFADMNLDDGNFTIVSGNPTSNGSQTIGIGEVGVDYTLTFNGENSNGILKYFEDENEFSFDTNLIIDNSDNGAEIDLYSANTAISGLNMGDTDDNDIGKISYDNNGDFMQFTTDTSVAMTINSSQNVGIGIVPDSAKLSVNGGDVYLTNSGSNPAYLVGDDSTTNYGRVFWDSANDYLRIEEDGTNGPKINGNNFTIGNIFPSQPLIVGSGTTILFTVPSSGQIVSNNGFVGNEDGADSDSRIEGDTDANLLYVDAGQDFIGVGDATPSTKLDVNGKIHQDGLYGEIYASGVTDTITITSSGKANKVQITSFATNGESNDMTPDHTNDHITVATSGRYLCTVSVSATSTGGTAYVIAFSLWKNNGATEYPNVIVERELSGAGGDTGSMSLTGIVNLNANDTMELWGWNQTNTNNVVIENVSMAFAYIGR